MANASDRRPLEVLAEMFSEFVPDPETPPATDIHFYMAANYPRLTEIHMRALELEAITGWKRRNVFALLKGNYYFPDWDGFLSALRAVSDRKGV
jgi:hypothetical protein